MPFLTHNSYDKVLLGKYHSIRVLILSILKKIKTLLDLLAFSHVSTIYQRKSLNNALSSALRYASSLVIFSS